MFEAIPEAKPLFRSSMKLQGRMLVGLLSRLVESAHNREYLVFRTCCLLLTDSAAAALTPHLEELARRHVAYGVKFHQIQQMEQVTSAAALPVSSSQHTATASCAFNLHTTRDLERRSGCSLA